MVILKNKILIFYIMSLLFFVAILFLAREKEITVVINGIKTTKITNAITVNGELNKIKQEFGIKDFMAELPEGNFLNKDDVFKVNTAKNVFLTVNGKDEVFTTYTNTTKEFLIDNGFKIDDETVFFGDFEKYTLLKENNYLDLATQSIVEMEATVSREIGEIIEEDPNKLVGSKEINSEGKPEVIAQQYKIVYHNGVEVDRILIGESVVQQGSAKVIKIGTKPAPAPNFATGDTVWDQLVQCEASGNWAANTGNGYYGGLQFAPSTWTAHAAKVGVGAAYANEASREEQILVASSVQKSQGWGAWPSCSRKLGLY